MTAVVFEHPAVTLVGDIDVAVDINRDGSGPTQTAAGWGGCAQVWRVGCEIAALSENCRGGKVGNRWSAERLKGLGEEKHPVVAGVGYVEVATAVHGKSQRSMQRSSGWSAIAIGIEMIEVGLADNQLRRHMIGESGNIVPPEHPIEIGYIQRMDGVTVAVSGRVAVVYRNSERIAESGVSAIATIGLATIRHAENDARNDREIARRARNRAGKENSRGGCDQEDAARDLDERTSRAHAMIVLRAIAF